VSTPVSVTKDERVSQFYPLILELHSLQGLEDVLNRVLQFCVQAVDAPHGLIALIDYEKELLDIRARTDEGILRRTTKLGLIEPIFKKIAFEGHHEIVSDYANSSFHLPFFACARSAVYVPLTLMQTAVSVKLSGASERKPGPPNVVAILIIESNRPSAFSQDDMAFLLALSTQTARLIKTMQRLETLQKENQLRDQLTAKIISMDTLQSTQLDQLLKNILELAFELTGTAHGTILLLDETTGDLLIKQQASKGDFLMNPPSRLRYAAGERSGISFEVLRTRNFYICNDVSHDPHYVVLFRNIRSNLGIPILFQGRAIGVLLL
jgi:GAF domain-containing protein